VTGIFYYVSGHGYGHAVRSAQVISAILDLAPGIPLSLWVRTSAPAWLFPAPANVEAVQLDVGVLQRGSLHVRRRDTLRAYAELMHGEEARISAEVEAARARGVSCVVADIPSAAFEIARRLDVPGIGVANFCWHWIYEPYAKRSPEHRHVVEHIHRQEAQATVLLRLPFAWDLDCFKNKVDVPLIGRRATRSPSETRAHLRIERDRRVALLSFGGYGLNELGEERLHRWQDWLFLTTDAGRPAGRSGNILNVPNFDVSYVDLMAASDAVVTKPGFGIVSDALVTQVPVLYSDRGEFREYGALSRALRRFGRAKYIPRPALVDGMLGPYLDALMEIDRPWTPIDISGAKVIAQHILNAAGA
jgi:L-arabinokinase